MSYLNSILTDLREKRLWPIALVLLAALVAVPLLLSSSTKPAPVAQSAPATPPASGATALPAVSISSELAHARLKGKGRDPFTQMLTHATTTTTAATTAVSAPSPASASSSAQASPATNAPAASSTTPTSQPAATAGGSTSGGSASTAPAASATATTHTISTHITYFYYAADLAFWRANTKQRVYRNAARFRAFPSMRNPLLVFLGVKNDGRTAVFLVSSLAQPSGAGKCLPNALRCTFLDLKVGQHERIRADVAGKGIVHYRLTIKAIRMVKAVSPKAARTATAHASAAGTGLAAAGQLASPLLARP